MKLLPKLNRLWIVIPLLLAIASCNDNDNKFDASGTFEAEETIISAEATGVILQFDIEEGQALRQGQLIGYIDSIQLHLKKKQLMSQINSILSQRPDAAVQVAALEVQLNSARREQVRIENLVKAGAATQKQLDDINTQADMIRRQLEAQRSSLAITTESITQQTAPLRIQIQQTEDMLRKCRIVNPASGTVLTKYAEKNEMATPGKPLYRVADLSNLMLRAYITGDQLPGIKLNQKVRVLTDAGDGYREHQGVVTWISDKAEFTPRTIQTKKERANLVYAVKVKVPNDGTLKLGMYGEVKF